MAKMEQLVKETLKLSISFEDSFNILTKLRPKHEENIEMSTELISKMNEIEITAKQVSAEFKGPDLILTFTVIATSV